MTNASANSSSNPGIERELTVHQRNLVDTCFEEGNYEAAISLLDKFRHPKYKPYKLHVRNLVYIALYPTQGSSQTELDTEAPGEIGGIPASPSKVSARHHRASHTPKPADSVAAQRVLRAFAQTNTPESLFRALPSYTNPENNAFSAYTDEDDSDISKQSRCIRAAKNCWEVVKEGFIQRDVQEAVGTTHGRRRSRRGIDHRPFGSDEEDAETPDPIGQHAWCVFETLLTLLEKDEAAREGKNQPRYSQLLLSQIPPSRVASVAQWDVEAPLDIVFYCLRQPERTILGARLLSLLINLSSTTLLDFNMLLNVVRGRVLSLSPNEIQTFFSLLPQSIPVLRFKVALCKMFLTDTSTSKGKVKPQARTAPRPLAARPSQQTILAENSSAAATPAETPTLPTPSIARKYPVLTTTEIIRLLAGSATSIHADPSAAVRTMQFRFYILSAFGSLQEQLSSEEQDPEWERVIQNGELTKAIDDAFHSPAGAPQEDQAWAEDLKAVLTAMGWHQ